MKQSTLWIGESAQCHGHYEGKFGIPKISRRKILVELASRGSKNEIEQPKDGGFAYIVSADDHQVLSYLYV
jgi:hypothetical protein